MGQQEKKEQFWSSIENDRGDWLTKAKHRRSNRDWLRKSQRIAVRILRMLKQRNIQQKDLAEALDVSPQQVSKIVQGKQNLTLETIAKLEQVLGVDLIEVPKHRMVMDVDKKDVKTSISKRKEKRVVAHIDLGMLFNQNWTPSDDEAYRKTA